MIHGIKKEVITNHLFSLTPPHRVTPSRAVAYLTLPYTTLTTVSSNIIPHFRFYDSWD